MSNKISALQNVVLDTRLGGAERILWQSREKNIMRAPDVILKSVVFIGAQSLQAGSTDIAYRGTGFCVSVPSEQFSSRGYLYLITARHNIMQADGKPIIRLNNKDGSYHEAHCELEWSYHPTDETADIAVLRFPESSNQFDIATIPTSMFVTEATIIEKDLGPGDDTIVSGLFTRFYGNHKNIPVMRFGNVAMMPSEKIKQKTPWAKTEIGLADAYLIEVRSIGGLSGSPVFIRRIFPKDKLEWRTEYYFLGLVHGHWDISQSATGIQENINVGLAHIVPAHKILETLNQPALLDERRKADDQEMARGTAVPD